MAARRITPAKLKWRARRALGRGVGSASVWLDPARGPQPWRRVVGKARILEAKRRLAGGEHARSENLVTPLLDGGPHNRSLAWATVARARFEAGNTEGALAAARVAVGIEPVAFAARAIHYQVSAGTEEGEKALEAFIDARPNSTHEARQLLGNLPVTARAAIDRFEQNAEQWGILDRHEGQVARVRAEAEIVAAAREDDRSEQEREADVAETLAHTAAHVPAPVPPVARALNRLRRWEQLADFVDDLHPARRAENAGLSARALRQAAQRAKRAGYTGPAARLAGHALALNPSDRFAQDTWADADDQLQVVRRGWPLVERNATPRYEPRPEAVLSVLAQSLPHTSGGYATRTHGVLTGLVERGWDVRAVTRPGFPYDRWSKADGRTVPPSDDVDGVPYHRILTNARAYPQYPLESYIQTYTTALERHARGHRASLLHASSFHVNGLAAQAAAARMGVPFLYEMRGLEELMKVSRDPHFATSDRWRFLELLENQICHGADKVFVITQALKDLMAARGIPEDKMVVLPNGVHSAKFTPRPRDERLHAELGLERKTVVGYAGGLVDYEGLDLLLEAMAEIKQRRKDVHLVVVGDGHYEATLHQLRDRLGLGDVVTFTGRVPHDDVAGYLSLFDVTPFPRLPLPVCEAISPIKPFESMAMGRAVIVSSVAALTEIVQDGETGLVFEKGSATDLAAKIEAYAADPQLRADMGARARDWVLAERDWKNITGIVEATYRDVLG